MFSHLFFEEYNNFYFFHESVANAWLIRPITSHFLFVYF